MANVWHELVEREKQGARRGGRWSWLLLAVIGVFSVVRGATHHESWGGVLLIGMGVVALAWSAFQFRWSRTLD